MIFKIPESFNFYFNDFFILISLIFFSYFHESSFSPGQKNAQTRLVTSNLSIYLSQVWIVQTRKPNLHPLTTLFLPYAICHTSGVENNNFQMGGKILFWVDEILLFFQFRVEISTQDTKKQQWPFQSLLLKISVSYRNRTPNWVLGVHPGTENYLHSMLIKVIQSLDFTASSVNFGKDKKTCFHLRNYSLGGKMVDFPPLG